MCICACLNLFERNIQFIFHFTGYMVNDDDDGAVRYGTIYYCVVFHSRCTFTSSKLSSMSPCLINGIPNIINDKVEERLLNRKHKYINIIHV